MSYYQEPDSHIRDRFEVVLDLSKHATKNDTSDLAAKKGFFAFKVEVDKLDKVFQ